GDTQFPDNQAVATWKNVDEQSKKPDEKNQYRYKFVTLYKKD
ncbi:diacylglycerol kinase, partial [Pseudoalteromonas undina]